MAFNLHVTFSGPCLYVLDTVTGELANKAAVLMPDCRLSTHPDPRHLDDDKAEPHVGYISLNVADLDLRLPSGVRVQLPPGNEEDEPAYELVHRFSGQVLEFGAGLQMATNFQALPSEPVNIKKLYFPNFGRIAPGLDPKANLFGSSPPQELLVRTRLSGGMLFSTKTARRWKFSAVLNPNEPEHEDSFASFTTWMRQIEDSYLTVRVTDFNGNEETRFFMGPFTTNSIVTMKVGNLCAFNPLDWDDLPVQKVPTTDMDFKWVYQLLRTRGMGSVILPTNTKLPAPDLLPVSGPETGEEACMGGIIASSIP